MLSQLIIRSISNPEQALDLQQDMQLSWAPYVAPVVRNPPADAGDIRDVGLTPGLGRSPGGGHGNPLQYSCLESPMDREAWRATVHVVAESQTQLK